MIVDLELPEGLHPDTRRLVHDFAKALGDKLHRAEKKYGYSNGWLATDWEDKCRSNMLAHIGKGDPLDVAAFCAFMWLHRWPTIARPFEPHLTPDLRENVKQIMDADRGSDDAGNIRSSFG